MTPEKFDVVVIGGGFSGVLAVYKLRRLGFKVRGIERQDRIGGVWSENAYPGAAVDSPFPFYQFYDAELLHDWRWGEQFPTRAEMLRYFEHVDAKWKISASFEFGTSVSGAEYSEVAQRWTVSLEDGRRLDTQWLVPAVGFSSVVNIPPIPNMDQFCRPIYHTARWPRDAMDMRGKKVAVVGTGPSGVQIIQSVGKVAKAMTIYQQTPCLTLRKYSVPDKTTELLGMGPHNHREALRLGLESFNGFDYMFHDQDTLTVSAEERDLLYKKRYLEGGWAFWMAGFRDLWRDLQANRDAYAFWAAQTRARITGEAKRELLVPKVSSLPFGVKRPCLEEDLYEVMDQPNVEIIDVSEKPIEAITETGIRAHGRVIEVDVIILATGFGDEASGLKKLNIRGRNGIGLQEAWSEGVGSHLGIAVNRFPNMFFLYGPQSPTLLVNSPAVITVQVEWLCRILSECQRANVSHLEATAESQRVWQRKMGELWEQTLYHKHPRKNKKGGKLGKHEQTWIGGLLSYRDELENCLAKGMDGFNCAKRRNQETALL